MLQFTEMKNNFDVAIIGGGPAGIMSAIITSEKHSVILIEKNEFVGRKILATGNGRCNLTNCDIKIDRYHGGDLDFIKKVLANFNQFDTMKFFENLGVVLKEEDNGRIFPRTNQAQTIVDALTDELIENKVNIKTNSAVKNVIKTDDIFKVILQNGDIFNSKKLILSTGGKASAHLGSSGDGYFWVENMGHTTTPTSPALVPIETVETWPAEISGLKVEGKSTVTVEGVVISEKSGDILFTHFGVSAPAIMYHATHIGPHLGKNIKIHLDLFPDLDIKALDNKLTQLFAVSGKKAIKNTLSGIIPSNLAPVILNLLDIKQDKKTAEVSKEDRLIIATILKDLILTVKQLRPFKEAQVTRGGITLTEIDANSLQSKIVPGLYFAGEILDCNGDSGGFNLQWAWSSGHLAGQLL